MSKARVLRAVRVVCSLPIFAVVVHVDPLHVDEMSRNKSS